MERMKIYRMRDVCETTGLKPSTIYKLVRTKAFPAPVKLTNRSSGWTNSSVDTWVASRLADPSTRVDLISTDAANALTTPSVEGV
jgi:prophage regulatory protein